MTGVQTCALPISVSSGGSCTRSATAPAPAPAQSNGPAESAEPETPAVEQDERETEAAIVYMLETTERRALENQINQSQKMDMVGQLAGGIVRERSRIIMTVQSCYRMFCLLPDPSTDDICGSRLNIR